MHQQVLKNLVTEILKSNGKAKIDGSTVAAHTIIDWCDFSRPVALCLNNATDTEIGVAFQQALVAGIEQFVADHAEEKVAA